MRGQIILSHGTGAGPDATKISALAEQAEALGWRAIRPDFRREDERGLAASVAPRLEKLLAAIDACVEPPVLVGSSMGAFASGLAASRRKVAGLFLLATPTAIPDDDHGFELPSGVPTLLIHGWRDEVCALDDLHDFARRRGLPLLVLDDDHRLGASVPAIAAQFRLFLEPLA